MVAVEWPLEERALSGVTITGQVSVEGATVTRDRASLWPSRLQFAAI